MDTIFSIIRKLDIFSVPYTFSLNLQNKKHKNKFFQQSLIGGLISLIIYLFTFVYGIILLSKWFNYEMAFKIATQDKYYLENTYSNFMQSNPYGDAFSLYVVSNIEEGDIEYFKSDAIIYIPLLYNENTKEVKNLLELYDNEYQQITFSTNNTLYESNLILFIATCLENQQYLTIGQTCANRETYEKKTNYDGLSVNLDILKRKLDYQSQNVEKIDDSYTFSFLQKNFSIFKFISLDYSFYTITSGLFQEQQSNYMLTTSFNVRESQGTTDYVTKFSQYYVPSITQVQAGFYFSINTRINEVLVQYPSIAEILASIGSITQTMLLIGILIRYMNRRWMTQEIKSSFKQLFFPELSQIIIKKVGQTNQYFLDQKQINKKNFEEFINTIDQKIEEKMNYENLIYEISRIQVILEEVTTQFKIFSSHKKKFELDLIYEKNNKEYHVLNYWKSLELVDLFKKYSFAPFSLNFSTKGISGLMISNLQTEQELITYGTNQSSLRRSSSQNLLSKQPID